jgi:secreted trypsin-like serine protease
MRSRIAVVILVAALLVAGADQPPGGGRIVGGQNAREGSAPWQVEIAMHGHDGTNAPVTFHHCGGTLVAPAWVLTATHCLIDHKKIRSDKEIMELFEVRAGSVMRDGPDIKVFKIDRVVPNPDWKEADGSRGAPYDNYADIALLHVVPDVIGPGSDPTRVRKALLPTAADTTTAAMVTGWGATEYNGQSAAQLQYAMVTIIPLDVCATANGISAIDPTMLCAWHKADADAPKAEDQIYRGTCQGDSGGPLVVRRGLLWVVVGVVSRAQKCGEYPARYTRVAAFVPWIKATIGGPA